MKYTISLVAIFAMLGLFVGQNHAQLIAPSGTNNVLGMWLFDDEDARDYSGNGNDGEIKDNAAWAAGKFGKALELAGDGYVEIPNSDTMNITGGPITVVCWFKANALGLAPITRGTSRSTAPNRNWDIFVGGGDVVNWVGSSGTAYIWTIRESPTKVQTGVWYHAAGVWDGTTNDDGVKLYIDGQLEYSAAATGTELATNLNVHIGGMGTYSLNGLVDEVAILDKALTQAEIQEVMESGLMASLTTAVSAAGKMTSTWSSIKTQ